MLGARNSASNGGGRGAPERGIEWQRPLEIRNAAKVSSLVGNEAR